MKPRSKFARRWFVFAVTVGLSGLAHALDPATHDRLIEAARRGDVLPALERFEAEIARESTPPARLLQDAIVLNVWAERHARALELAERLRAAPPAYVSSAIALALRRTRQFDRAIALYRELLAKTPADTSLRAELVHALVDADRLTEAEQEIDQHVSDLSRVRQATRARALLIAAARVRQARGQHSEALSLLLDADTIESSDETRRGISLALTGLSAPSLALAYSRSVSAAVVPENERERLEQNETARRIGYGEVQLMLALGLERFARTGEALAKNANDLSRVPEGSALHQNALFDRMLAARDHVLMEEVIELERRAERLGYALPPYARAAAADAWLYLRKPEQARDRYLEALAAQRRAGAPETTEWRFSLVYAYLEAEQWQEASDEVDRLLAETPSQINRGFGLEPNPNHLRAQILRASLDRFGERLWAAQEQTERLLALVPHNTAARDVHAGMLARHGLHAAARDEWLRIRADAPDQLWPRISVADMEFSLHRPDRARPHVRELARQYPEHRGVQRLVEEEKAHHAPRLRLSMVLSGLLNDETKIAAQEADLRAYLRADTPLLADRFRLYFDGFLSWEQLSRRSDRRERGGLGLDYTFDDVSLWGLVHRDRRPNAKQGYSFGFNHRIDDRWGWRALIDTNTTEVALRASLADIHARQVHLGLSFKGLFERRFGLAFDAFDFDDGNRRRVLAGSWFELWQSEPRFRLESYASLGGSTNTRRDAPYFNPQADAWADVTLTGQWLTWREYEHSFKQRLHGTLGAYWQKGFSTLPILGIRYEHEWERQRSWVLRYGIGVTRRPYDGQQETRWQFYLDAGWKPW